MIRGLFTFEGGGAGKRRCKVLVFGECEGGDDDEAASPALLMLLPPLLPPLPREPELVRGRVRVRGVSAVGMMTTCSEAGGGGGKAGEGRRGSARGRGTLWKCFLRGSGDCRCAR